MRKFDKKGKISGILENISNALNDKNLEKIEEKVKEDL